VEYAVLLDKCGQAFQAGTLGLTYLTEFLMQLTKVITVLSGVARFLGARPSNHSGYTLQKSLSVKITLFLAI
jgi:hypothetical protein